VFQVTRVNAAPREIKVHLQPTSDWTVPLGGVGEPGFLPIAPVLCNAIFATRASESASFPSAISSRAPKASGRPFRRIRLCVPFARIIYRAHPSPRTGYQSRHRELNDPGWVCIETLKATLR
jgi:hypothetical protein